MDGLPENVDHLALRRIADALEALLELKRQEATGELQPTYAAPKDKSIWIECRKELVHLLDETPFVEWDTVKENPTFRDKARGNMYREHQWRRFLQQHAIPNKPEDGGSTALIALDKPDKNGPLVCTRQDSIHCGKPAYENPKDGWTWRWEHSKSDPECHYCQRQRKA